MSATAVLLLVLAAASHAGWNLLSKRQQPTEAFFWLASFSGTLALAPTLLFYGQGLRFFSARVWLLLGITGLCQAVYYAALAGGYRSGDLSLVYPLARSAPALIVTSATRLLGQGEPMGGLALMGIALLILGGVLLPLERLGDLRPARYLRPAILLALLAALGTSGYSLVDDAALRILRQTPGLSLGAAQVTLLYAFFEGVFSVLWLALWVLARPGRRAELRQVIRGQARHAALAGVMISATYAVVLIAMSWVTNVGYVVAFRQLSIPLRAVLGVAILGEPRPWTKLVGVATMFTGVVLVGLG